MDDKENKKKLLLQKMQKAKIEIQNLHSGEHILSPIESSTLKKEEDKITNIDDVNLTEDDVTDEMVEALFGDMPNITQLTNEELEKLTPEEIEQRAQQAIEWKEKLESKKNLHMLGGDFETEEERKEYVKSLKLEKLKALCKDEDFNYSYDGVEVFKPLKYPTEPSRMIGYDLEKFMVWAVAQGTSDVFIATDEKIICDIYGKKHQVTDQKISNPQVIQMISHIYKSEAALSRLNGASDVDCQWSVQIGKGKNLRFRINITSHQSYGGTKGYEITIRTINGRAPLLETLNLPSNLIKRLSPRQGLIMIAGATGSGKSTLLASVLDWRVRDPQAHIKVLTYEKPIEFIYDEVPRTTAVVSQVEIGVHLLSFEDGIVNSLRRKPDIILVGEMRDKETIGEGITASMTGHLVFGTVHATTVANTVLRMVNVFGADEKDARKADILGSIQMIVAQKLLLSTDGKRVAVREFLYFDNAIKDYLSNVSIQDLSSEIQKFVDTKGQAFIDDITDKFLEGRISKKVYDEELLTFGYK